MSRELFVKLERLLSVNKCVDSNYKRLKVDDSIKKQIIDEQEGKCFLCTCKTTIPLIHHIKPDGDSVIDNLLMICPLCHRWVHWILKKYFGYRGSIEPFVR